MAIAMTSLGSRSVVCFHRGGPYNPSDSCRTVADLPTPTPIHGLVSVRGGSKTAKHRRSNSDGLLRSMNEVETVKGLAAVECTFTRQRRSTYASLCKWIDVHKEPRPVSRRVQCRMSLCRDVRRLYPLRRKEDARTVV